MFNYFIFNCPDTNETHLLQRRDCGKYIGSIQDHLNTTLLFEIHFRQHPRLLFSPCGNDGRVPYRRPRTIAQVPLNLQRFLPETNIARNSNLGLEVQPYGGGAIILGIIMEIV